MTPESWQNNTTRATRVHDYGVIHPMDEPRKRNWRPLVDLAAFIVIAGVIGASVIALAAAF